MMAKVECCDVISLLITMPGKRCNKNTRIIHALKTPSIESMNLILWYTTHITFTLSFQLTRKNLFTLTHNPSILKIE